MDQIDAVRVFLEVAERQSFTAAADRLGLSKAMVSKHVGLLEDRVRARLFNRTTRRVALTEAGARFLPEAQATLAAWERMMEAPTEDTARPSGLLRIASPKVFGETVLAPLVAAFLAAQPNLRIDLACEERHVDIVGEGFDLAIRLGDLADSAMIVRPIAVFPYVLGASDTFLAQHGVPEHPDDLAGVDCVVNAALAPGGQWVFDGEAAPLRVTPRVRIRVNTDSAAAAMVRGGLGIGLLMRRPLEAEIAAGRVVPVLERFRGPDRVVHAIIPHRDYMPAKTRLFLDYIVKALRQG